VPGRFSAFLHISQIAGHFGMLHTLALHNLFMPRKCQDCITKHCITRTMDRTGLRTFYLAQHGINLSKLRQSCQWTVASKTL